ncbi:hypothetical protein [Arthrobacter sp. OV608]|uniref:hypothetical protein n=1 Tax=Arthrobacter sp. OV608 TaxID=1882768 RepID=UPI0008BB5257|nr:hypothetical protein [Arthrobacter sp. OV608]SER28497.1 hypothetical protein SAMN05444745_12922 [Arthrobacter sp. OV608]
MSTERMPTDLIPQDSADWATLARQFVEVRRDREVYRRGYVDDVMPDGSGLWMAVDGVQARELIWREQGFTVAHLYSSADGVQPQLEPVSSYIAEGQEEVNIVGGRP